MNKTGFSFSSLATATATATATTEGETFFCITSLPQWTEKSLEEIRWEDTNIIENQTSPTKGVFVLPTSIEDHYHTLTAQPKWENKSLEELRWEYTNSSSDNQILPTESVVIPPTTSEVTEQVKQYNALLHRLASYAPPLPPRTRYELYVEDQKKSLLFPPTWSSDRIERVIESHWKKNKQYIQQLDSEYTQEEFADTDRYNKELPSYKTALLSCPINEEDAYCYFHKKYIEKQSNPSPQGINYKLVHAQEEFIASSVISPRIHMWSSEKVQLAQQLLAEIFAEQATSITSSFTPPSSSPNLSLLLEISVDSPMSNSELIKAAPKRKEAQLELTPSEEDESQSRPLKKLSTLPLNSYLSNFDPNIIPIITDYLIPGLEATAFIPQTEEKADTPKTGDPSQFRDEPISKYGGIPYMFEDESWPICRNKVDERPMNAPRVKQAKECKTTLFFLLQIRKGDLPPYARDHYFYPSHSNNSLFQIFYCCHCTPQDMDSSQFNEPVKPIRIIDSEAEENAKRKGGEKYGWDAWSKAVHISTEPRDGMSSSTEVELLKEKIITNWKRQNDWPQEDDITDVYSDGTDIFRRPDVGPFAAEAPSEPRSPNPESSWSDREDSEWSLMLDALQGIGKIEEDKLGGFPYWDNGNFWAFCRYKEKNIESEEKDQKNEDEKNEEEKDEEMRLSYLSYREIYPGCCNKIMQSFFQLQAESFQLGEGTWGVIVQCPEHKDHFNFSWNCD